jgi:DNA-directed RNA polymerase I and III subunit RPAC1
LEHDKETGKDTKVVIKNPRLDTVSREVLRYPEFRDRVKLGRVRDHFICKLYFTPHTSLYSWLIARAMFSRFPDSIESTGAYNPEELFPESIGIMLNKIRSVESCMRARFPGLVPPIKGAPMEIDPEEAFANEGIPAPVPKTRGGRKAKK